MEARPVAPMLACVALLSAWLGASVLVATVVAPAAFAVLPSRTLAGALVGRVLPVVFWSGALIGVLVLALGTGAPARIPRTISALALITSCAVAQLVVSPRIDRIRRAVTGPMDALAVDDPRRIAFGKLHGVSVGLLGVAMLAALVALALLVRAAMARSTP